MESLPAESASPVPFLHKLSACRVDEEKALLHSPKEGRIRQVLRLLRDGDMEAHDIAPCKKLQKRSIPDAVLQLLVLLRGCSLVQQVFCTPKAW